MQTCEHTCCEVSSGAEGFAGEQSRPGDAVLFGTGTGIDADWRARFRAALAEAAAAAPTSFLPDLLAK